MQRQLELAQKLFDLSEKSIQEWIAHFVGKPINEVFDPPVQYQERIEMVKASDPNECYYIQLAIREDRKENENDVITMKLQSPDFAHVIHAFNQSIQIVTASTLRADSIQATPEQTTNLKTIQWTYEPNLFRWKPNIGTNYLCIILEKMTQSDIDRILGVASIDAPQFEMAP